MSIREIIITANDESKGMTAYEIREALEEAPPGTRPRVTATWGGKVRRIKFMVGGFGQTEADRGKI